MFRACRHAHRSPNLKNSGYTIRGIFDSNISRLQQALVVTAVVARSTNFITIDYQLVIQGNNLLT